MPKTQTRIRILGSGPVKKFIKTRNAYNSESRRDPDPQIGLQIMRMGPDSDFRMLE
jgi:hypothetical protein